MDSGLLRLIKKGINGIDAIPKSLLIFIAISSHYLIGNPRTNEEQYLALSKYFVDPSWILNSINLNEFAGTRYLYQIIAGNLLKFCSFEETVFVGRFIVILLLSFSLAFFYKKLNANNFVILLHLVVVYFVKQSHFGASWIFLNFEAKCLAYGFAFFALGFFLEKRFRLTLLFIVITSYFHILVGGFIFFYLGLYILIFEKDLLWKEKVLLPIVYFLALSPFIYYLLNTVSMEGEYNPSPNWIYSYFRNPHHTIIFESWDLFYDRHYKGVLSSILLMSLTWIAIKITKLEVLHQLIRFTLVMFAGSFIFIVISAFDTDGVITKYYLFRINALSTFCATLVLILVCLDEMQFQNLIFLKAVIFIFAGFSINGALFNSFYKLDRDQAKKDLAFEEMCNYIKAETPRDNVIMYLHRSHPYDGHLSFIRKTERSRFVVHKFVPADFSKLPEWYDRIQWRKKVVHDIQQLKLLQDNYKVDLVLSKIVHENLDLVKEIGPYRLYKAH